MLMSDSLIMNEQEVNETDGAEYFQHEEYLSQEQEDRQESNRFSEESDMELEPVAMEPLEPELVEPVPQNSDRIHRPPDSLSPARPPGGPAIFASPTRGNFNHYSGEIPKNYLYTVVLISV